MDGKVKIIGFDEDLVTLRGITEGIVDGTIVQQPFEFGYQSMIRWPRSSRATNP